MANKLIKHLQEYAKNDDVYKPLESQWAMDELLISKALQNICIHFPHYSRHDESHSRQILVHIERLLGEENISKLTATDTWLLLEAAYLHDIGMLVTDEQLNENFEEIKKHAEKMKYTANGDELVIIEALLTSKQNSASAIFATVNLEAFQSLKLLREIIANFYREKHPEKAGKIITYPAIEIGLNSPRNELLPARFFGLLSKICEYHGASFAKVMELPKQQVGLGTDDCHPRFIACLLRLGDLLDLDDNRFCPVMMKMAGELPSMSKAHHEKHLAIRHFRADSELIEIEADCPSYESYIETTKWFGWLREEVKNQMEKWFDIVPSRHFGLLPSVGDLKAHLKDWQVFSENKRPQFTLDCDRMFELLQGAGLYDGKEQAMRELLQNAIDATLIRIWREYGEDANHKTSPFIKFDSTPSDKDAFGIFKKYSLDVKIEKENEEEKFNYWRITITDQGTGISRHDLKFLMSMGSSKKNRRKRAVVDKMPIWMKSSGIFGIGFHSIFLLTEEAIIETRSIDTGETLVIQLTNPTNSMEHGNIYFQIITESKKIELPNSNRKEKSLIVSPWNFSRYGCQLSFIYKANKYTIPAHEIGGHIDRELKNYDAMVDESSDFYIVKIIGDVFKFFNLSMFPWSLSFEDDIQKMESDYLQENEIYYSPENKLQLLNNFFYASYPIDSYYRGQYINDPICYFKLIQVKVNLLDDNADQILSLSRNKFRNGDIKYDVFLRVSRSIQEFFKSENGRKHYFSLSDNQKETIAAEYQLQDWEQQNYFSKWDQLLVNTNCGEKKIAELAGYDVLYCNFDSRSDNINCDNSAIYISKNNNNYYPLIFLCLNNFKSVYIKESECKIVRFDDQKIEDPISNEFIKLYCTKNLLSDGLYHKTILKRQTIPCLNDYLCLTLKKPNILPSLNREDFNYWLNPAFDLDLISPRMLFPLAKIGEKITIGDLDILAKRVYKNREDEKTTLEEIKIAYQKFIQMLDTLMQNEPQWKILRGSEFSL